MHQSRPEDAPRGAHEGPLPSAAVINKDAMLVQRFAHGLVEDPPGPFLAKAVLTWISLEKRVRVRAKALLQPIPKAIVEDILRHLRHGPQAERGLARQRRGAFIWVFVSSSSFPSSFIWVF